MLSTKVKLYLLTDNLFTLLAAIGYVLINFFLWEDGQSIQIILIFNFFIFLALLVGSIFSGYLSYRLGTKFVYVLAILVEAALLLFAHARIDLLVANISIFAFVLGLFYSLLYASRGLITQNLVSKEELPKFNSIGQIIGSIVAILSPILVAFLITKFGYEVSFLILGIIILGIAIVSIFYRFDEDKQTFELGRMFRSFFQNDIVKSVGLTRFSLGITYAFFWGILDILILSMLGSLAEWSKISVVFAIVGIILSIFLGKIKTKDQSKSRAIIALTSLVYATVPILLISNFTLGTFLLFSLIKISFEKVTNIVTGSYIVNLEATDIEFKHRKVVYQTYVDFTTAVGRLVPIIFFLALPNEFVTENLLVVSLAVASLIPLTFAVRLKLKGNKIVNYW